METTGNSDNGGNSGVLYLDDQRKRDKDRRIKSNMSISNVYNQSPLESAAQKSLKGILIGFLMKITLIVVLYNLINLIWLLNKTAIEQLIRENFPN